MNRLLNFLLIILIISNVFLAFTIVIAPRTSMVFLESLLGNPYNTDNPTEANKNKTELTEIELTKPVTGTIETPSK